MDLDGERGGNIKAGLTLKSDLIPTVINSWPWNGFQHNNTFSLHSFVVLTCRIVIVSITSARVSLKLKLHLPSPGPTFAQSTNEYTIDDGKCSKLHQISEADQDNRPWNSATGKFSCLLDPSLETWPSGSLCFWRGQRQKISQRLPSVLNLAARVTSEFRFVAINRELRFQTLSEQCEKKMSNHRELLQHSLQAFRPESAFLHRNQSCELHCFLCPHRWVQRRLCRHVILIFPRSRARWTDPLIRQCRNLHVRRQTLAYLSLPL